MLCHSGLLVCSIVVTRQATKFGLDDGNSGGCVSSGRQDRWSKVVEELEEGCCVTWMCPGGDGTSKGGR